MSNQQATMTAGPFQPGPPKGSKKKSGFPWWSKVLVLSLLGGFGGMTALLLFLRLAPLPDASLVNPTHIDDANGQRLAEWTMKGTHTRHVPIADIPMGLRRATIATEDVNFYHHNAFNPLSLGRAMLVNLKHGHVVEGGSTITQQLAKNLFLSQDRTIVRKFREALYAIQLELHESKDTILEQYLNAVYYGNGAYGVDAAARQYFNKPLQDLSLAECAMLAGLPKGPSIFNPVVHPNLARDREYIVLQRMVQAGFISQTEANKAFATPVHVSSYHPSIQNAPYFTASTVQEMQDQYHLSSDDLYRGNITVTTTLDPVLQHAAERAIATTLPKQSGIQAAIVALDPNTGAIKAMVGGRNYQSSPYNRVFAERSPGSTFKAILYTAALEHGWTPAFQVNSEQTTFHYDKSKVYTVHDYGDYYAHRPLTLREAIARSDNVYAVTTNLDVGPGSVLYTARKMGMTTPLSPYPSMALGVFPTSPLQMATVYATLANGGYRITPYTIADIRDANTGRDVQAKTTKERAVSPDVAYQMSDLLKSVLEPHGTGYGVHQYLHDLASAKTGTTNSDVWMVGYTPNIVCAVWVGYDDNRALDLTESHLAAPIWAKFMGTAQQREPASWYTPPKGLVKAIIDPVTAKRATDTCAVTETDWFAKGTEPQSYCPLHPASVKPVEQTPWYQRFLPKFFWSR